MQHTSPRGAENRFCSIADESDSILVLAGFALGCFALGCEHFILHRFGVTVLVAPVSHRCFLDLVLATLLLCARKPLSRGHFEICPGKHRRDTLRPSVFQDGFLNGAVPGLPTSSRPAVCVHRGLDNYVHRVMLADHWQSGRRFLVFAFQRSSTTAYRAQYPGWG
jgi:hypothetical protein